MRKLGKCRLKSKMEVITDNCQRLKLQIRVKHKSRDLTKVSVIYRLKIKVAD